MTSRISRDDMLMAMAIVASKRSTCGRLQVGAILAIDGRPISTGYAGPPSGAPHCVSPLCDLSRPCTRTIHAEANAILFAAKNGVSIAGATLYTTHSPCIECAKWILNSGIKRVVYWEQYRDSEPIRFLCQTMKVEQATPDFNQYTFSTLIQENKGRHAP